MTPTEKEVLEYQVLGNKGMEDTALRGVVAANMNKNFVQRIASANPSTSLSIPVENGYATHKMAYGDGYVFPTVHLAPSMRGLVNKQRGVAPPEVIDMGSDSVAGWFAENYKRTNPAGFGVK